MNGLGDVDYKQNEIEEPDRDVDELGDVLKNTGKGDTITVEAGISGDTETDTWKVLKYERGQMGFEHRVTMIMPPLEDGWTRMYITGCGHDNPELDDWELVSMPYHVPSKTADQRDFVANGWIVSAEIHTDNAGKVDR